jgi:hypothetical protein
MATAKKLTVTRARAPAPKKIATKATSKPVAKPAVPAVPAAKAPATPASKTAAKPAAKVEKPKKPKLVRDSFTIPKAEVTVLDDLKLRAVLLARPAKKSELLRAGIKALAAMSDGAFLSALQAVPAIKTGRPTKA